MPEDQHGALPNGDVDFAFDDPDEWRDFSEEDEDDGKSLT